MQILIHACPARMWYVDGFLVPELRRQGAKHIEVWNDTGISRPAPFLPGRRGSPIRFYL